MSADPTPPTPRRRRVRRAVAIGGTTVLIAAGGAAYWALDRFVIDHVEVSDTEAFEAAAREAGDAVVPDSDAAVSGSSTTAVIAVEPAPVSSVVLAAPSTDAAETSSVPTSDSSTTLDPAGADAAINTGAAAAAPTVKISTVVTGTGEDTITYFVADVVLGDVTALQAGFAERKFGENIIANTSTIAADYGASFAINGDYYGFRSSGIVIRNGVLYRDDPARQGLAIFTDGTMRVYDETTTSGEELLAAGAWHTLSFGPALLDGGEVVDGIENVEIDTNFGNHSIQGSHPRTGIGMIEPGHFVFVVVDGRSPGYSRGVTLGEFAEIFDSLGATVAYNLDGGGSATMVANGELVNDPLGRNKERGTSDILYIV